jgi:chaperone modulatory protein CbpM
MIGVDAVIRLMNGLEEQELRRWIEERWVRPEAAGGDYLFREVDVARVQLIVELRHELAIDEEAMPVVLRLLDQIYALRRRLKATLAAIETQPEEVRAALRAQLAAFSSEEEL